MYAGVRVSIPGRRALVGAMTLTGILVSARVARPQQTPPLPLNPPPIAAPSEIPGDRAREPRPSAPTDDAAPPLVTAKPRAVARLDGDAAPGGVITLSADGSVGESLSYRWVQTGGPAVEIADPNQPTIRVRVPEATAPLGFLLVVGNREGVDTAVVAVPVETAFAGGATSAADPAASVRADAGDDQVGLVGHLITLNGLRSEPRGRLAYRWIQVGGPAVRARVQDAYICSFIPPAPGLYRFALVVAADGRISEP